METSSVGIKLHYYFTFSITPYEIFRTQNQAYVEKAAARFTSLTWHCSGLRVKLRPGAVNFSRVTPFRQQHPLKITNPRPK